MFRQSVFASDFSDLTLISITVILVCCGDYCNPSKVSVLITCLLTAVASRGLRPRVQTAGIYQPAQVHPRKNYRPVGDP